ncbi:MAG: sigma-70 family RNA polymerase sigma factor [bacterium]
MFDRRADLKLIKQCKRGEEQAFEKLLNRYRGAIYNLCYRMTRHPEDARDLAQEVFIKVFSLLDRYDEGFAFSSWLFRIATNHCIDYLRRNRLRFLSLDMAVGNEGDEIEIQFPDKGPQPDTVLQRKEALSRLSEVISELPPHYRLITLLRHDQQLSYEEIAEILDLPLGTVKARIHRARNLVQQLLKARSYDI